MTIPAVRLRAAVEAGGGALFRAGKQGRRILRNAITLTERAAARLDARHAVSLNTAGLVGVPDTAGESIAQAQALLKKAVEQRQLGGDIPAADELARAAVNMAGVAMRQAGLGGEWDCMMAEHGALFRWGGGG